MKKTTLLTMILFFAISFTLTAQNRGGNRSRQNAQAEQRWTAKNRAENIAKQLNLDEAQKAKIEALFEKQDAKRAEQLKLQREKRDRALEDRETRREAMRELREQALAENDAELEKIIGKEKMEQWKTYREDYQKRMRDGNRRAGRNQRAPRNNAPNSSK